MNKQNRVSEEMSRAADNYWDYVPQMLAAALHAKNDIPLYLQKYRGLVDFGISPQQINKIKGELPVAPKENSDLKILFISDWILNAIDIVTKKAERVILQDMMERVKEEITSVDNQIRKHQGERRSALKHLIDFNQQSGKTHKALITALPLIDKIKYDSALKNESASRGRYFDVDERRTFATERQWVMQQERRVDGMLSLITEREKRNLVENYFNSINQLINEKVAFSTKVFRMQEDLNALEKEIETIPVAKIIGHIAENVLRLKTIVSEDVKRVGGETGVFRAPNENVLSINELHDVFTRIAEYDRDMFLNNQAVRFGKPSILLVPGKGNGMYDYRDNLFIIPMIPNFNIVESLSFAFIAYRIHNDLEKKMIRSYGALPLNREIGHRFALIKHLKESYAKWVSSEYEGFRVLEKDERRWFSNNCGPKKEEFYVPLKLIKGGMAGDEYARFIKDLRMKLVMDNCGAEEYWYASVISCQQGQYEKSVNQIKKLISMSTEYIFAYFNLGLLYVELNKPDLAYKSFQEFLERNSQSSWARVAQEFVKDYEHEAKRNK